MSATSMESHSYANAPGVAASGVALKQAREARNLGIAEVASTLKLTPRQIEAIESEAFDQLPGSAFARGFVRNYARYLGLDPAPLLERMEQPARGEDLKLAPESNAEGSVPRRPSGYRSASPLPAVMVVGAIVVLGLVWSSFNWFGRGATPGVERGVSQSAAVAASEPIFPPHTEETAVVTAQVEPAASASEPVAAQSQPATASVAQSSPVAVAKPAASQAPQSAPTPLAQQSAPVGAAQGGLNFSFAQDAWVEVRDASGSVVFSRLSKAGSTQTVQGTAPFALVIGNAPNVKVEYNGRPVDLAPYTKVSVARLSVK
ncbi:RodZ domain-containing protein [Niveibacterium sp. COAC-50]|uniref:RodZ domain-containing protein n=1 Tax=Niveibacterium sp. COAC-50 TaxID=2729384 RepID=UPI0015550D2E|nr:RodZ domain-containing protein [Niveibacterium sp. COAC-50]